MKPDDPSVGSDEILYRYSPSIPFGNWTVVDQETGEVQIALGALHWDDDGISCYRKLILNRHEMDWSAVKREPKNGVFSLIVGDVRNTGLGVAFDPNPETDQPHPRDVAHTLIVDCGMPRRANRQPRESLAATAVIIDMGRPKS
ncbi:hypothetical protein [Mycobacterium canetti]|uniref:hypothetical protein n=1 Tax=Mycobacterium canetti TaxID=78331 RepID=UPI0002E2B81B|nr:hypothetical protein [Mycobacterium canetti]